jgi:FKBP-type peptidyl-prolyl cis-trans isomerase
MKHLPILNKSSFLLLIAACCLSAVNAQTNPKSPINKAFTAQSDTAQMKQQVSPIKRSMTAQMDTFKMGAANKKVVAPKAVPEKGFVAGAHNLDYKWVTHGTGKQIAKVGDFGEMSVVFKIGDTTIINTNEMNEHRPVLQPISAPGMKGDLMEGIVKMKAGDSVVFRMKSDTFFVRAKQPKPSWVKSSDYIRWEVKMHRVLTKTQLATETAAKEKAQKSIDDKILQDYFKAHNIKDPKKAASGLYFTVIKEGVGEHPIEGQEVSVNYSGETIKGEKFDSNTDSTFNHVEPLNFALGKHNVISGWDEAVALMNKGMKARFYIPSSLAYGDHGQGPKIGPNEILIFDIELLSFK